MRCCKSCGCYLPDGVSECLACGYDETAVDIVPRSGIGIDRSGYGLGQCSKNVRHPMDTSNFNMQELLEMCRAYGASVKEGSGRITLSGKEFDVKEII